MLKRTPSFVLGLLVGSYSLSATAVFKAPPTAKVEPGQAEPFCNSGAPPEWRQAQTVEGVTIQESRSCNPDNPNDIAAFVKGTNNISMETLMDTSNVAADTLTLTNDMDKDGDPDHYVIKLEIMEVNGHSPDFPGVVPTFDIAPGIQPTFWVFTPKSRDMSTRSFASAEANPLLRMPSPPIRVEQGDVVWLVVENSHYFPHSIHLHGVDHPFMDHGGEGNDGVGQTSEMDIMPGQSKTYVIRPRQPGTMYYHCHVQPHTHIPMGLAGMFIIEENRPNNWPQVFNIGAGQVRHPSVAVQEKFKQEYDLQYSSVDKELHQIPQSANDVRLIAKKMNQEYDITDAKDDYYLLNGRAFPYTLRESLITVNPNEKTKIRVLNGHTEPLALHIHGHKATETHYDGVQQNPSAQVTRDVYSMAPAQRLDLVLDTTDDGLHSFGSGLWMFHDHTEKAFTTDGMGEGGSISLVAYKDYVDENGTPKSHGMDLKPYFTKEFWERKLPVWQDHMGDGSLGAPAGTMDTKPGINSGNEIIPPQSQPAGNVATGTAQGATPSTSGNGLFSGILLGVAAYFLYLKREKVLALLGQLPLPTKNKQ